MAQKTKIEWTDRVWNPVTGCTKVSQGCKNCYAEGMFKRLSAMENMPLYYGRKFSQVQCHPERLTQPLHWRNPQKVFVNSMSDLFHDDVPFEFISKVFEVMEQAEKHTFIILTKRPIRMLKYFMWDLFDEEFFPKNIWLGVSVEDQQTADERIPLLLQTPAKVRFVSIEPMLGGIKLNQIFDYKNELSIDALTGEFYTSPRQDESHKMDGINWLICGGESGPHARPMHPDWPRSLRNQCAAANVPFFFKQWGEWLPFGRSNFPGWTKVAKPLGCLYFEYEDGTLCVKVGKAKAGRLLDGIEYSQFPNQESNR